MDFNTISELETLLIEFSGVNQLILMLSDCALEGGGSMDCYPDGISAISTLANNCYNKLKAIVYTTATTKYDT